MKERVVEGASFCEGGGMPARSLLDESDERCSKGSLALEGGSVRVA